MTAERDDEERGMERADCCCGCWESDRWFAWREEWYGGGKGLWEGLL